MNWMRIHRRSLLAGIGVAFVILTLLIICRGWIRSSLIPSYVDHFYQPHISKTFEQEFKPVNQQLKVFGFGFTDREGAYHQDGCHEPEFSGFQESVFCVTSQVSDDIAFTDDFQQTWEQKSPDFEKYLLAHGWQKQWNGYQPINEILANPNNDVSVGVVYAKSKGAIRCELSVSYYAQGGQAQKVGVHESCSRTISFLGGY